MRKLESRAFDVGRSAGTIECNPHDAPGSVSARNGCVMRDFVPDERTWTDQNVGHQWSSPASSFEHAAEEAIRGVKISIQLAQRKKADSIHSGVISEPNMSQSSKRAQPESHKPKSCVCKA